VVIKFPEDGDQAGHRRKSRYGVIPVIRTPSLEPRTGKWI
jgi:hypothetical protein